MFGKVYYNYRLNYQGYTISLYEHVSMRFMRLYIILLIWSKKFTKLLPHNKL